MFLFTQVTCPPIRITFLGTGTSSGVPMVGCTCEVCTSTDHFDNRLRSSVWIQSETTSFIIDTTPDFRYQMLRANVPRVDAVLYTHAHKDHTAGLDDIRGYNYIQQQAIPIYCTKATERQIRAEFAYAFAEPKYPGVPDLFFSTVEADLFFVGDIPVQPIQVWHFKMPVLGFKIGDFVYITDANKIEDSQLHFLQNAKVLVLNALRHDAHISHFTLQQAIDLSASVKAQQTFFTHISHQLGIHSQINITLPPSMQLAYDGLTLQL